MCSVIYMEDLPAVQECTGTTGVGRNEEIGWPKTDASLTLVILLPHSPRFGVGRCTWIDQRIQTGDSLQRGSVPLWHRTFRC